MAARSSRYSREFRAYAVSRVKEVRRKYSSESAAIGAVAQELNISAPDTLRKWVDQAAYEEGSKLAVPSNSFSARKVILRSHPIVIGVVIAVLAGLGLTYLEQLLKTGRGRADLQVDQLELTPPGAATDSHGATIFNPLKIDIKLLNNGTGAAAINNARIIIQRFVKVPVCETEGAFGPTGTYSGNMPIKPHVGSVVNIGISQLVGVGGADRFDLLLHSPIMHRVSIYNIYLYRAGIYLGYNAGQSIHVGDAIFTLPFTLGNGNGAYIWTRYLASHPSYLSWLKGRLPEVKRCMMTNSRNIAAVLSFPGVRTANLAALSSQLAY